MTAGHHYKKSMLWVIGDIDLVLNPQHNQGGDQDYEYITATTGRSQRGVKLLCAVILAMV